jgi:hypothetical protein
MVMLFCGKLRRYVAPSAKKSYSRRSNIALLGLGFAVLVAQPLRSKRKIGTAGKKPIVYLPEDVVKAIDAKVGDEVDAYVEGKKTKKLDFPFLGSMAFL